VNLRSAYLHVLGDALGSVGAIVAGLLMYGFSWYAADPLVSLVVAALIVKGAWRILRHAARILMEGTPHGLSRDHVERALRGLRDVVEARTLLPVFRFGSMHQDTHLCSARSPIIP